MATESSRSSSAADSYIGSLISLTSKSEIRYEGTLYNINTDESSIGLRDVRSFGTEGRKKDGPQVMASEKVYEYILFRGSDIKDLQVKSTPPIQPPVQTHNINSDPAIIQSHYPRPSPTSFSLPPPVTGSSNDNPSHTAQVGQPGSVYQGSMPWNQSGGNMGSWGQSSLHPSVNGNGHPGPMYWPGYYGPNGLPQPHQQSLLRSPPNLPMPPSVQQPMQYPAYNPSFSSGTSNISGSNMSELPSSLFSTSTSSLSSANTSLPSSLPPVLPVTLSSEALPSFMQNKAPDFAIPMVSLGANLPSAPLLTTSSPHASTVVPPIPNKPTPSSASLYSTTSQHIPSLIGLSTSVKTETKAPALITPEQLLQSGQTAFTSALTSQIALKDVEGVQVSPQTSSKLPVLAQLPILPLPQQSHPINKPNGGPHEARNSNYIGREGGKGSVNRDPVINFTEEFDFMTMNKKFNKDEVWGYLGQSNKASIKENADEDHVEKVGAESHKLEVKPVYSKDEFFDTLSCNSFNKQANNGRTKFSEQTKLDTETFGEYSKHHNGRGGRGGRCRGGYHGRGYGYYGRGRVSNRDY